jgi:hypothetical protein
MKAPSDLQYMSESSLIIRFMRLLLALLALFLGSCSSMYFHTLDEVPTVETPRPSNWPWQEYWTGVIFNGEKIGFTHQQFVPDQERFRISSEAALRLRFLMIDKELTALTHDWVDEGLHLERFEYVYKIDKSRRQVKGKVQDGQLALEVSTGGQTDKKILHFKGELVPMNALYLYPVLHGLQVGKVYHYQIFDGETLAIYPVEQTISAYQSSDLFAEKAFRVETEVMDLTTTSWLDATGLPQIELSLNGTLISALEPEEYAKEYLAQAALAKSEFLLAYSQIPVANKIENPRSLMSMHVRLNNMPEKFEPITTPMQQCHKEDSAWVCQIHNDETTTVKAPTLPESTNIHDVTPSMTVNSSARVIINLANEITENSADANEKVSRILDWMNTNIEKENVDSFNSLDVLEQRKAECQGHSLLFAALVRSQGIPTRLLNGVVYSEDYNAFLYHTWVESYIDDRWQAIDPTFGQRHADATHIALIEGEEMTQLIALLPLIGKLKIEVVSPN